MSNVATFIPIYSLNFSLCLLSCGIKSWFQHIPGNTDFMNLNPNQWSLLLSIYYFKEGIYDKEHNYAVFVIVGKPIILLHREFACFLLVSALPLHFAFLGFSSPVCLQCECSLRVRFVQRGFSTLESNEDSVHLR